MTTSISEATYGPKASNRLAEATDPTEEGARAALESFYYALNNRDLRALSAVWTTDELAQLNNPIGGILRGGNAITELYDRIFNGPIRLTVEFGDIAEYTGKDHAVFAGRETGEYVIEERVVPVSIRTTRYFRYDSGSWAQFHHHGSIDDPQALAAYQRAIAG